MDHKIIMEYTNKLIEVARNSLKSVASVIVAIVVIIVVSAGTTFTTDYFRRANDVKKSELHSKLLWNNIGQCFYAELDDFNKYFKVVRIEDCDKTK